MAGRARGVVVSGGSAVVVCQELASRHGVTFKAGNATSDAIVMLRDTVDPTATNGVPLASGDGSLSVFGSTAGHKWLALNLSANDSIVGVVEYFSDDPFDDPLPEDYNL